MHVSRGENSTTFLKSAYHCGYAIRFVLTGIHEASAVKAKAAATSANSKARIDVEKYPQIDSIQDVTSGEDWESKEGELDVGADDDRGELLDKEGSRLYRAVAARLNYIAPDRSEMFYFPNPD